MKFFDDVIISVANCFQRYFDYTGRSSRAVFWHWQLFRVLLFLSITFLETIFFSGINFFVNFFLLIPEITVSIRRLHDINKSGWWCLACITPAIVILFFYLCKKGDDNKNQYGLNPLD